MAVPAGTGLQSSSVDTQADLPAIAPSAPGEADSASLIVAPPDLHTNLDPSQETGLPWRALLLLAMVPAALVIIVLLVWLIVLAVQ